MARVNLLITARDLTGAAFTRINARAHRLGRTFTTTTRNGNNAFTRFFRGVRAGFNRLPGDARRGLRGLVRLPGNLIREGFRGIGRFISGVLNDGIGQGLVNAFQGASRNPAILAAVGGLITTVAAFIGAGLAGALVLAFGGAFVGLGAYIAKKSQVVKDAWSGVIDHVKKTWKDAGEALEPVLVKAADRVTKLADDFLPHFKTAMERSAGPVDNFIGYFDKAIRAFGKRAFKPLMDGFDTLLLAFGPDLEDFFAGLGDSFAALGRTVRDHSGEISLALRMILGLITTLIDIINFLANVWVGALRLITFNFGVLIKSLSYVLDAIVYLAVAALDGFTRAFGWIPGLGGKLKKAQSDIRGWADSTSADLRRIGDNAINWGKRMDQANRKRKLEVDIMQWQSQLSKARADLKKTSNQKARAKLQADISDLEAKIKRARGDLSKLNGKTATTYVRTVYSPPGHAGPGGFPKYAHGGVRGLSRAASGGVRSNQTLVGETGPEVVDMPPGAHVRPNGRSNDVTFRGEGGGGGGVATLVITGDGSQTAEAIMALLRGNIKVKGGDVQLAIMGKPSRSR